MTRPTCATCRFFWPINGDIGGECRNVPPKANEFGIGDWPRIQVFDWCGKHEPIPAAFATPDEITAPHTTMIADESGEVTDDVYGFIQALKPETSS